MRERKSIEDLYLYLLMSRFCYQYFDGSSGLMTLHLTPRLLCWSFMLVIAVPGSRRKPLFRLVGADGSIRRTLLHTVRLEGRPHGMIGRDTQPSRFPDQALAARDRQDRNFYWSFSQTSCDESNTRKGSCVTSMCRLRSGSAKAHS